MSRSVAHVDPFGFGLSDPSDGSVVGFSPGPTTRRLLSALPTNGSGPVPIRAPEVVIDPWSFQTQDPSLATGIGSEGLYVHRLLWARMTEATRTF
jgi:hypothetical protein